MFEKLREKTLAKVAAAIKNCDLGQHSVRGLKGRFLKLEEALAISERTVQSGFSFDENHLMEYLKAFPGLLNARGWGNKSISDNLGELVKERIQKGLRPDIELMVLAQWDAWSSIDLLNEVEYVIKTMIEPNGGEIDSPLEHAIERFKSEPNIETGRNLSSAIEMNAGDILHNHRPKIDSEMRRGIRRLDEASTLAYLTAARGRVDFFV
jgi:hypothetical protein